jgi:hypothetical protein
LGIPEWIAVVSVVIALLSLALQQHLTRQQSKAEAKARHCDRTQTLILRALDDPALLEAISGTSTEDQKRRRYLQLWLNHVEMIFRQRHFFDRLHWKGTVNDIRDFMSMPVIHEHWNRYQNFYADDFRRFMDKVILAEIAEAPIVEAPAGDAQASST